MPDKTFSELEDLVDRFFVFYSTKCVILAALLTGISSIGIALLTYALSLNAIVSFLSFGGVGLISIHVAVLLLIPPVDQVQESKKILLGAAKERSRIKSFEPRNVIILSQSGKEHLLKGAELYAWERVMVPYFMKEGVDNSHPKVKPGRQLTASERRYVEEQKKLIFEREKTMAEERKRIAEEKRRIEEEHEEMERRSQKLNDAEEVVISRLSEVEVAQAELEQLRENLTYKPETREDKQSSIEGADLLKRESELKAKEDELEKLKKQLLDDQRSLQTQKADFSQLKGEFLQAYAGDQKESVLDDTEEREKILEDKLRQLEEENQRLLERSQYIEEVENALIDRLHHISEREAFLEQREINSGLRADT